MKRILSAEREKSRVKSAASAKNTNCVSYCKLTQGSSTHSWKPLATVLGQGGLLESWDGRVNNWEESQPWTFGGKELKQSWLQMVDGTTVLFPISEEPSKKQKCCRVVWWSERVICRPGMWRNIVGEFLVFCLPRKADSKNKLKVYSLIIAFYTLL